MNNWKTIQYWIINKFPHLKISDVTDSMLKSLRVCDNTFTFRLSDDDCTSDEFKALVRCLRYQHNLQCLNLSGTTLFGRGELLNSIVSQLNQLCELHLVCCDIDSNCLAQLEQLPSHLRVLDLSYNPLVGADSQHKLHKLIQPLERLQILRLRYCELNSFSEVLSSNSLVELDISWNPIGGQGAANLLQRQLISLNLSNTQSSAYNHINVIDKIFFNDTLVSFTVDPFKAYC